MKLTKSKLKEMIKEVINEAKLKDVVPDIISAARPYTYHTLDHIARRSWDSSDDLIKKIQDYISHPKLRTRFKRDVKQLLKKHSIKEGNPTPAVQKKLIKIFQNDPLYKDVIMATNSKDFKKAIDTLRSIRGPNAIKLLKKHSKKLMGKDYQEK